MASTGSPLSELAVLLGAEVIGDSTLAVKDVTHDSRQAGPATLFVALRGSLFDGHDFADDAVTAGSPAVLVDHVLDLSVPQLVVPDTRRAMAVASAAVHAHPSERLALIGVTGTNGKTTVTHLIESIVAASSETAGLIGTVHTRVGHVSIPSTRTTPESSDFQRLLATMADAGASVVAAEVSSHALVYGRVDATRFAVAGFTNLSQDHLDFHGDMESYYAAKRLLFAPDRSDHAVVFVDDDAGRRLASEVEIPVTTVGAGGDVSAVGIAVSVDASSFVIRTGAGEARVDLPVGGRFNVDNALVAAACAIQTGISLDVVAEGLTEFGGVPGRFEVVSEDDPVRVVVDYAHTPAGIREAIATVRDAGAGRIIVVFGAGGDRDQAKRPQMGAAAAGGDVVVVTSDNPRSEDPEAIIDQVMEGLEDRRSVVRESDRRAAMAWAIDEAREGDVVLVLGRGHERRQEIAGQWVPFDDRLVARELIGRRRGSAQ